jgi:hypothetical protein
VRVPARHRALPRPAPRPGQARKRPRRPEPKKRGRGLLLLLAVAFAAWMMWPSAEPPPEPFAVAGPRIEDPKNEAKPQKARPAARKPTPPKVATASVAPASYTPDREKLLEAIRDRSRELASCGLPPGSPAVLPARLRIARSGEVRSLRLASGAALPEALSTCARAKIGGWKFAELALQSDVEILVSFELGRP